MTLQRIIIHWTAGGPNASGLDKEHYHFIVQQDGQIIPGKMKPEDNASTKDGKYAAHTLNCNTGSIGVALCGMAGAVESPFSAGAFPIKWPQIAVMCSLVAKLCHQYGIKVSRQTVLSHAEVQPTLGIKQRGKIDIMWLPGMTALHDPIGIGDRLRGDILQAYNMRG